MNLKVEYMTVQNGVEARTQPIALERSTTQRALLFCCRSVNDPASSSQTLQIRCDFSEHRELRLVCL